MDHDSYPDAYIRGILNTVKTIAMVGVSANDNRPSYFAFKYLLERGYRMIPVNPGLAGRDRGQIASALRAFRDGKRPATVMTQLAKGFTEQQIDTLAAYFAAAKP